MNVQQANSETSGNARIEQQRQEWTEHLIKDDDFVASLFQDQEDMLAELEALQLELNSTTAAATHSEGAEDDALFEKRLAEWENRREEAEMELARQQARHADALQVQDELLKQMENLDASLAEITARTTGGQLGMRRAKRGQPQALIFINGNVAPFSDHLIQSARGKEVATMLVSQIKNQMTATDDQTFENPHVSTFLFHHQKQVAQALQPDVISAPSSFSEFIKQFGKKDGCTVVDLTLTKTAKNDPVLQHIALLVRTLGVYQSVKRIYLVGIHPMSIKEGMRMLGNEWDAAEQAWMSTIFPKLVLVNHQLDPDPSLTPTPSRPIVTFPDLFSSSISFPLLGSGKRGTYGHQTSNSGGGTASGWEGGQSSVAEPVGRKLNPNRGMLNQDPLVCYFHYLGENGCTRKSCPFSHDYVMTPGQLRRVAEDVAAQPCDGLLKTGKCRYVRRKGENCIFSHNPRVLARFR